MIQFLSYLEELNFHRLFEPNVEIHAVHLDELPRLAKLSLGDGVDLIEQEPYKATKTLVQRLHTFEPHTIDWGQLYFSARLPLPADSFIRRLVWPVNARPEFGALPHMQWLEELDLSRLSCDLSRVDLSPLLLGVPRLRLLMLPTWIHCGLLRVRRSKLPLLEKLLHPVENCWWLNFHDPEQ